MGAQEDALKTAGLDHTLRALARQFEPPEVDDEHAPVRRCHRYLNERRKHLNYRDALAKDCRSAPARSKARIATSSNNASNAPEPGGG